MNTRKNKTLWDFGMAFVVLIASTNVGAQQLIKNGSFESGNFDAWTLADQLNPFDIGNNDHFYLSTPGANTPSVNGVTFSTAAHPSGGSFYAVSASDLPGAHALLQNFNVPLNVTQVMLTFQMFVNDQIDAFAVDPSGLDYTSGGAFNDNQHARVDLLTGNASNLSTNSADIVQTLYGPNVDNYVGPGEFDVDLNALLEPYKSYSFNLTGILTPGQTYRLRFAEVDNLGSINLGLDNVSLLATPTPEPGSFTLFLGLGVTMMALISRYRRLPTFRK